MTSSSITKRADVVAESFLRGSLPESQPLEKRYTTCSSGMSLCSDGIFCCTFFSVLIDSNIMIFFQHASIVNNSSTCRSDRG